MDDDKLSPPEIESTPADQKKSLGIGKSMVRLSKGLIAFLSKISLIKVNESLSVVVSIIIRVSIVAAIVFVCAFFYNEFNDKSYHIQEFQVPEVFIQDGYNGKVVAHKIQDHIQLVIRRTSQTFSQKEIEEYSQSSDQNQVQLEVAGVGLSPDALARYVKQLIGVSTKNISGEITVVGKNLKLTLRITGQDQSTIEEPIVDSDVTRAIDNLIKSTAREILKITDPVLLGIYYSGNVSYPGDPYGDSLAIKIFRYAIVHHPKQASNAYAWWAKSLMNMGPGTFNATKKIRKSLELDSGNAVAFRFWSSLMRRNGEEEEAEKLIRKSLALDSTSGSTWWVLGNRYLNREKDKEAEACFRRSVKFDPDNWFHLESLCMALLYQGKLKEATEVKEILDNNGVSIRPLELSFLLIDNDTAAFQEFFDKRIKDKEQRRLSSDINNLAFSLENRNPDLALRIAHLSIKADSTFSYPYTTLAEIYGLRGDDEKFYFYLEMAFKKGFPVSDMNDKVKPYNRFASQEKYQRLKTKYQIAL